MEMFFTVNNIVKTTKQIVCLQMNVQTVLHSRRRQGFLQKLVQKSILVLSNLLWSAKPKETSLEDIGQELKNHNDPVPLEIIESFHFSMRNQLTGESISDYIVVLKKLSINRNYGEFLH